MTKEEYVSLFKIVISSNLDDVLLGMQLLLNSDLSVPLFRYLWTRSLCSADDLGDLYGPLMLKGNIKSPYNHERFLTISVEDYWDEVNKGESS